SHVYFPTYSNRLKEIGRFLGANWTAPTASGLQSIAWRREWERSGDECLKDELIRYNLEDCLALRRVTDVLTSICHPLGQQGEQASFPVALASDVRADQSFWFSKPAFFCPELAEINKRAYSDYQREKVYFRTSPALRRSLKRKRQSRKKRSLKINKTIECGHPKQCPFC